MFRQISQIKISGQRDGLCFRIVQRRSAASQASKQSHLSLLGDCYPIDSYTNITRAVISKLSSRLYTQRGHPICTVRELIESQFSDFIPLSSLSPFVTPAKNFDELSFPLDHPGRSVADSYYINKDMMLRTHTSAHEVEVFGKGHIKWLLTADVYRRDEIDASHYPIFHQMEGAHLFATNKIGRDEMEEDNANLEQGLSTENIEIEDQTQITDENPFQPVHDHQYAELVTANLKHSVNYLLLGLFGSAARATKLNPLKVRWIQAYFPFTSPSYEVEVFFQGKWLEILGCGVVQQATLDRARIQNKMGWAFGLGLERIAMILYSIPDIRLFWSQDPRFISQFTPGKISTFRSYSKFPPCVKDISFWVPEKKLHDNDVCDLVRVVAGDLVEEVKLIDSFTDPRTKRSSVCYRINYRSMDKSMSNDEVNAIHARVASNLSDELGVEIR